MNFTATRDLAEKRGVDDGWTMKKKRETEESQSTANWMCAGHQRRHERQMRTFKIFGKIFLPYLSFS
jgi:hypothetical protein